ncbi:MAG: nuclease [Gammaproteobacteria bacterium]|nr:MAG: nuclease [Gammaproteobacteria bacterium]
MKSLKAGTHLSFLLWLALVACAIPGFAEEVRVHWIADGDTVRLEDGRRVRLLGIDAPETGGRDGRPQYYASEARARLIELVSDTPLRLQLDAQEQDRYGRVLAWLYLPDGRLVNEILVEEGFAFFYHHSGQDPAFQTRLLAAQRRAMAADAGFWPRILALPVPRSGWVGNRRSRRFHHPDSAHAGQISPRNRVVLHTIGEAFHEGYAPARGSSSWPDAGSH